MWRNVLVGLAVSSCVLLAACGGFTNPMPLGNSNSVPMSLTNGDPPPDGVAVLFFRTSITGASLQPSDSSKPPAAIITPPVEFQFGHFRPDTHPLSLPTLPP